LQRWVIAGGECDGLFPHGPFSGPPVGAFSHLNIAEARSRQPGAEAMVTSAIPSQLSRLLDSRPGGRPRWRCWISALT